MMWSAIWPALLLQAAPATPQVDCDNAMTQAAMNLCAGRDFQAADRALNRQWTKTAAEMRRRDKAMTRDDGRPGYFDALLDAQRKWLAYRDAHCRAEGYMARGGSMEPMLVGTCKADLTRKRTAQLRDLIEWGN